MNSPEVFYLNLQGEQRGPYTIKHIDHLLNSGLISRDVLFWREGLEQWLPVTDLVVLRKPKPPLKLPLIVLSGILVLGAVGSLLGPIAIDGWREIYQHEFSVEAAYWRARDTVRTHLPKGAVVSFEPLVTQDISLAAPDYASVVLRGSLIDAAGLSQSLAWKVSLKFDPAMREWTALEATVIANP